MKHEYQANLAMTARADQIAAERAKWAAVLGAPKSSKKSPQNASKSVWQRFVGFFG